MVTLQRGPRTTSRTIEIGEVRSLRRADLAVLATPRPPTTPQKLRDNHHRVARAIANGLSNALIAETCGLSVSRVNVLRAAPAVIELVAHYRAMLTAEWVRESDPVIDFMRSNALKAQAMLSDKLDDAAEREEFLPTRDLLGIAELGLDRTGYGKLNKNVNINMDFAAHLEAARARSAGAPARRPASPNVIDALPVRQSAPAAAVSPQTRRSVPTPPQSILRRM